MSVSYPWVELQSDDGTPYYWNQADNTTTWDLPSGGFSGPRPPNGKPSYSNGAPSGNGPNFGGNSRPPQNNFGGGPNYPNSNPYSSPGNNYGGSSNNYGGGSNNYGGGGSNNYGGGYSNNAPPPPKDKSFTPNLGLKTAGSHNSISLPTAVVKQNLRYEDVIGKQWDSLKARGLTGEKCGYLERLKGATWFTQWFVLNQGSLFWFKDQLSGPPEGEIPMRGAEVEENRRINRPWAIHIFTPSVKKHYCLVAQSGGAARGVTAPIQMSMPVNSMPINSVPPRSLANPYERAPGNSAFQGGNSYQGGNSSPYQGGNSSSSYQGGNSSSAYPQGGGSQGYGGGGSQGYGGGGSQGYGGGGGMGRGGQPRPSANSNNMYSSGGPSYGGPQQQSPPGLQDQYYAGGGDGFGSSRIPDPQIADDWEEHSTPDGQVYFWNRTTGESSWEPPLYY